MVQNLLAGTIACVAGYAYAQEAEQDTALETIVVTASGFEQNVKDAPASG